MLSNCIGYKIFLTLNREQFLLRHKWIWNRTIFSNLCSDEVDAVGQHNELNKSSLCNFINDRL